MRAPRLRPGHAVVLLVLAALPCSAQPRVINGPVTERAAGGMLEATARELMSAATEPAWIAWEAPLRPGDEITCWDGSWKWRDGAPPDGRTTARLEPADTFFVFVRAVGRRPERVRIFGESCELDAGGRPVTRLTGVTAGESVAFLTALAADDSAPRKVRTGALSAIAQHGTPEATASLLRLARSAPAPRLRSDALFWVAQRAGEGAAAAITDAIANDPETEVKKRAVFALSQLPGSEGVPRLIEVARTNRNPAVRKQAMFWLGQSNDPRALAFFEEVLK
jgi:hypothetical protein